MHLKRITQLNGKKEDPGWGGSSPVLWSHLAAILLITVRVITIDLKPVIIPKGLSSRRIAPG